MPVSLTRWLAKATPEQIRQLTKRAKTSVKYLQHLTAGRRTAKAEMAVRIAAASGEEITQGSVCADCRSCRYYKALH